MSNNVPNKEALINLFTEIDDRLEAIEEDVRELKLKAPNLCQPQPQPAPVTIERLETLRQERDALQKRVEELERAFKVQSQIVDALSPDNETPKGGSDDQA